MRILNDGADLDIFFRSLAAAPESLLMLDYDGTLSPFTPDRNRAFPYPGVGERLAKLMEVRGTRVIIVSGRAVADLVPLLGMARIPEIWGSHGWEHLLPDGTYVPPALTASAAEGIRLAALNARTAVDDRVLETKPASVALHWRGGGIVPDAMIAGWRSLAATHGLELHLFDGGVELRPPGNNKGNAVAATIGDLPREAAIAYLGDDATDEDAFNALGNRGLKVLVQKQPRRTRADILIEPPGEVLDFLDRWIDNTRVT